MAEVVDKERKSLDPALDRLLEREQQERKDYIYCAVCSSVIGRGADRIKVNGGHDHYCINPHGLQFHIGCFQEALGCEIEGSRRRRTPGSWAFAGASPIAANAAGI